MSGSRSSESGTGRTVRAIVVAVLVGAAAAVAGSAGGLRIGGWPVFGLCTAVAYLINWAAFVPAWLRRTERFYDLTGTLTYLTVVVIALVGVLLRNVSPAANLGTDHRFSQVWTGSGSGQLPCWRGDEAPADPVRPARPPPKPALSRFFRA